MNSLTHDDKLLVYFLVNHVRVNLSQTIFNHLRYSITIYINQHQSILPFGRVLSALFFNADIIRDVRFNRPENALEEERCEVLRV